MAATISAVAALASAGSGIASAATSKGGSASVNNNPTPQQQAISDFLSRSLIDRFQNYQDQPFQTFKDWRENGQRPYPFEPMSGQDLQALGFLPRFADAANLHLPDGTTIPATSIDPKLAYIARMLQTTGFPGVQPPGDTTTANVGTGGPPNGTTTPAGPFGGNNYVNTILGQYLGRLPTEDEMKALNDIFTARPPGGPNLTIDKNIYNQNLGPFLGSGIPPTQPPPQQNPPRRPAPDQPDMGPRAPLVKNPLSR